MFYIIMCMSIKIISAEGRLSPGKKKPNAQTRRAYNDRSPLQVALPVLRSSLSNLSVRKAQMRFLASLEMSLSSGKVRAFLWFIILL